MLEEKYKAKVEAMQIYVPLLTKLIAKLEAKNDDSEENVEKISQLKTLLKQLSDPKPGISFEELNECHQVMENMFKLNKIDGAKPRPQTTQINEQKEKEMTGAVLQKDAAKFKLEEENVRETRGCEEEHKNAHGNQEAKAKMQQFLRTLKETRQAKEQVQKNNVKTTTIATEEAANESKTFKDKENETENDETDNEEYENVELIEFSEEEGDESFEYEEMILPDDEEDSLFVDPKEKHIESEKHKESDEENADSEEEIKKSENKDEETEKDSEQSNNEAELEKEMVQSEDDDEQCVAYNGGNSENETEAYEKETEKNVNQAEKSMSSNQKEKNRNSEKDQKKCNDSLQLDDSTKTVNENSENDGEEEMELSNLSDSNNVTTKRTSNQLDIYEAPKLKKVKIWDPIKDIEIESALEAVDTLTANFVDPLAVDELSLKETLDEIRQSMKGMQTNEEEQKSTADENTSDDKKTADDEQDDDDDDVEIIESRNSPILIDSDDDEAWAIDDAKNKDNEHKNATTPKTTTQPQPPQNLIISNVKSLNEQPINNLTATKSVSTVRNNSNGDIQRRVIVKKPGEYAKVQTLTTKSSSNLSQQQQQDLQPKTSGPNPQLFSTRMGNRNLLIPNAFYGNSKKHLASSSTNPDIAHCRWLENFLRHFCSPYQIAHNTCFLLLQRSLRAEDYALIREKREKLNVTKGEVDEELLRALRCIFYVDGDYVDQKLSFVGRKFCNLAFVNILDKTISLTVDWRTNGVTSRTRISAATLEAVRQQKGLTLPETATTDLETQTAAAAFPPAIVYPSKDPIPPAKTIVPAQEIAQPLQTAQAPKLVSSVIPATVIRKKPTKKSSPKAKNVSNEVEIITGDKDVNSDSSVETPAAVAPRRSRRNASRLAKNVIANRFIYSDDDDIDTNDDGADLEFLPEKDESSKSSSGSRSPTTFNQDLVQVDISAAVKDFAAHNQVATEKVEHGKKATSFEMAFLERLAHHDKDAFVRVKQKASSTTDQSTTSNNQDIVVLDDDDDEEEEEEKQYLKSVATAKLPLEPRLMAQKRIKNIDSEIHLKGKYASYCLVCKRKVNHIVGHYVNMHPDCEVYVSRPTPAFAILLIKKQMEIATTERERSNLSLFVATCVFCEKRASFTLSYWYQHFASHTGEYAYQCSGCGIRKPSRTHLASHISSCQRKGEIEIMNPYDCSSTKITAYMCLLCYYTQMNLANVMKHIICEHGYARVQRDHWTEVTLLEIPQAHSSTSANNSTKTPKTKANSKATKTVPVTLNDNQNDATPPILIRDSNGDIFEIAEINDGKRYAVDLTSNVDVPPFLANEAENCTYSKNAGNSRYDEIGDVEGIIQAYINRKK